MAETIAQLGVEVKPSGITETVSQLERLNQTAHSTVASVGNLALRIAGYSTALNLGIDITRRAIGAIGDMAKESVVLAASFERSRVAWGVFLKDAEMGNEMFGKLYSLAQRTPLSFQGVEEAAQRLKGFGLATSEIIPTLERMGDVARGNDETMQRLSLAYGQALAQGRVLTRDLYQFVNAGVPIFDALAQTMGKTVQEVQALVTDGKVGFPEIERALKALTDQGGLFYGMMDKTAQTTEGKWSIAMDNWRAILADIGTSVLPGLNRALDEFNKKADYTIQKNNLSRAMTGQGGDKQAALAFAQAELAAMVPGNQSPERFLMERAVTQLQSDILESGRMRGSYAGPAKYVGGRPDSAKDDWRISLMDVTGIDATGFRLNAEEKWALPAADEIIGEYVDSLTSKYTPQIVAKKLAETYQSLLSKPGKFEASDNTMLALQREIDRFSFAEYLPTAVYSDRYMNMPGGGIPYLTAEEAASLLGGLDNSVRGVSSFTPYVDRYSTMAGAGSPYMTQWQAEEALAMMDARIAESYRQTPAMNTYVDPYSGKVGGGVRTLSYQQQARSNLGINGIVSLPLLPQEIDAYLKIAEANRPTPAYNTYVDPYTKRVGAGVPYMTTAESQLALSMMTQPGREKDFFGQSWMMDRQYGISEAPVWNDIIPTTDLEKFTAGQYELNQMMDEGKLSTEGYALALQNLKEQYDPATKKQKEFEKSLEAIGKYLESAAMQSALSGFYAIGEAMADSTDAAKNLEDGIQNIAHSILEQLPMMLLQAGLQGVMANPANPLAWGLIAASGMVAVGHGYADATAAQEVATTTVPNALGNVYPSRSLKQYENGVYNTPQFFAFAKGGVFGEAGYEAIMPLARSSTGQLGVKASVAPVNVVINNNAGVSVTSSESTNEAGERQVLLTIEKMMGGMVASGKLDKAMAGRYGTRVVGASRM